MPYNIFKSDGTLLTTIADNTIDSSSTSLSLVGKKKVGFGTAQNQSLVYLLENFAKTTAPSVPLLGQLWYDKANGVMKVCTDASAPTWVKVARALPNNSAPAVDLANGDLWWDSPNQKLYVYSTVSSAWVLVGPISDPAASSSTVYLTYGTTTNATPTEIFVSGVSNTRIGVSNNTSAIFEMYVVARRIDIANGDAAGWTFQGVIDNTSNNVTLITPASLITNAANQSWSVALTADNVNKALAITVTGETGKQIKWVAYTRTVVTP